MLCMDARTGSGWTRRLRVMTAILVMVTVGISGCATITGLSGVPSVPAHRVPPQLLALPKSDLQEISLARLRQDPPEVYQLAPGDVLGVFIQTILGDAAADGQLGSNSPPFQIPDDPSQPPVFGVPVPVREDGTVALPQLPPIKVTGLTLAQLTSLIRQEYSLPKRDILKKGNDRVMVGLIRKRTFRVLVVREESGGQMGVSKRGTGSTIDLPAYQNDVLHALNATGGLPGLDAKNEIRIYRGAFQDAVERDRLIADIKAGRKVCERAPGEPVDENVTVIPLRFSPHQLPEFSQEDIILQTGDIVMISSREEETYFTGGVLGGGEHALPRDKDLDVLGAIAVSGGQLGAGGSTGMAGGGGGGGGRSSGGGRGSYSVPASKVIILRRTPDGGQIPIRIDLNRALEDPRQRILIQPKDVVILRYTWDEELVNFASSLLQFNLLFNGFSGGGI